MYLSIIFTAITFSKSTKNNKKPHIDLEHILYATAQYVAFAN